MKNPTRTAYEQFTARVAQLNGVNDASKQFSVTPSIQQTLESKIQENSEFLTKINIIGVDEQEAEKLGLGVSGPIASRTNTANADRTTRDLTSMDANRYRCEQTNFDSHLGYQTLDAWAKFPDFQTRVRDAILQRQALDRIMIGFNGTSVSATTDIGAHPLLQDVNIGWLQKMRDDAPQRVMHEGATAGKVKIGQGGDYANLDAAVFDAVTLLDPWFREDSNLVVILGRELMHDKYFPLVNQSQPATEKLAADIIISQKRVGGLAAATVPFFPSTGLLITRLDNLSLYWQIGARRRYIQENPKRNRIENYESSNDAYVVEDYGLAAAIENIEFTQ